MSRRIEWNWIERFVQQFTLCDVRVGDVVVLLSETASRSELVETARLALGSMGLHVAHVVMDTPPNRGPVPIRSTGASVALAGHAAAVAGLAAATFVVDCTVEGLLHAPELGSVLKDGCRVLMVSNEDPETFERMPVDLGLRSRVEAAADLMRSSTQMRVTSRHGTDLNIDLEGAVVAGSWGGTSGPGDIAHWPGGLVLAFPAAGTVSGTIVMAPGDINLTFKEYVRSSITLAVEADYITSISGAPGNSHDADLFQSYLASFDEPDAYATSHVGFGMNRAARWDTLELSDKSQTNGTEFRAFAGNFLYSTGANETAGRFCRGHFDLPMRGNTIELDGTAVVVDGELQEALFL